MKRTERVTKTKLSFLTRFGTRLVVFAGLWWGLCKGAAESWVVGLPAILGASAASYGLRTMPTWRWRVTGLLAFSVVFLLESLRAGADVALRAITLDLAPAILRYKLALNQEAAAIFFAGIVSLLPGTLTTEIARGELTVHVLSRSPANHRCLARLENRVAAMFGE
jgi:multicomponent Na+:H+ antiporter subunit E